MKVFCLITLAILTTACKDDIYVPDPTIIINTDQDHYYAMVSGFFKPINYESVCEVSISDIYCQGATCSLANACIAWGVLVLHTDTYNIIRKDNMGIVAVYDSPFCRRKTLYISLRKARIIDEPKEYDGLCENVDPYPLISELELKR